MDDAFDARHTVRDIFQPLLPTHTQYIFTTFFFVVRRKYGGCELWNITLFYIIYYICVAKWYVHQRAKHQKHYASVVALQLLRWNSAECVLLPQYSAIYSPSLYACVFRFHSLWIVLIILLFTNTHFFLLL